MTETTDRDTDVEALLRDALSDSDTAWSLGSFGAIAEFMRDADEPVTWLDGGRLGAFTVRGAVVLTRTPDVRPVAYETSVDSGWNHAVALCLPADRCTMARRGVVTELGPDAGAARPEDREGVLFDLGLDMLAVDACVRSRDPDTIARLRAGVGKPLFGMDNPIGPHLVAMSPHRVFLARAGRIEVFQPIPAPDGRSPEGPHTHVMPKLLKHGRTHAATTPIPDGLVPFAAIHPAHPYKNALGQRIPFSQARLDAFQALLARWGDPELLAVKRRVTAGADADAIGPGRHVQGARRVAEAQMRYQRGEVMTITAEEAGEGTGH